MALGNSALEPEATGSLEELNHLTKWSSGRSPRVGHPEAAVNTQMKGRKGYGIQ